MIEDKNGKSCRYSFPIENGKKVSAHASFTCIAAIQFQDKRELKLLLLKEKSDSKKNLQLNLSKGVRIAWNVAVKEADVNNHEFIEVEHVLISILTMDDWFDNHKLLKYRKIMESEFNAIYAILARFNLDPKVIASKLRKVMGKSTFHRTNKIIHRSDRCKVFFTQATNWMVGDMVTCLSLFIAILQDPTDNLRQAFGNEIHRVLTYSQKQVEQQECFPSEEGIIDFLDQGD